MSPLRNLGPILRIQLGSSSLHLYRPCIFERLPKQPSLYPQPGQKRKKTHLSHGFREPRKWHSKISGINFSDAGPLHPNFESIDATIFFRPGLNIPNEVEGLSLQAERIIAIAKKQINPILSVEDNLERLGERILAESKECFGVRLELSAFPGQIQDVNGLLEARMLSTTIREGHQVVSETHLTRTQNCVTTWELANPAIKTSKLRLKSYHESDNQNYNQRSLGSSAHEVHDSSIPKHDPKPNSKFEHPIISLHNQVADYISTLSGGQIQSLAFEIASFAFRLADSEIACKRLVRVSVDMETARDPVSPMTPAQASVNVSIDRSQYELIKRQELRPNLPEGHRLAYIALGSNIGNRIRTIELACDLMTDHGIRVTRTSALYETQPMYLEDQDTFINGVCEVETSLSPQELLAKLKDFEKELGREKTIDNGPRTIDLDILLYDDEILDSEQLSIPHQRMTEREFVLRPLCDLIPEAFLPTSNPLLTFQSQLDSLPKSPSPLSPLTLLSPHLPPLASQSPTRRTHIMAILNLTPDSFSDGSLHSTSPSSLLPTLLPYLSQAHPITILDIGGQSTHPTSTRLPPPEELSRILPTIRFLRSIPSFNPIAISIDTYHASVARAAIEAGADIINDVSAGLLDEDMLPTIASLGCTCVLMHMRGTFSTMNTLTTYPSGVIEGVGSELLARVQAAEKAGIKRWRIILDPGIGFAKTSSQNLELLRRFDELKVFKGLEGFPWVVGASRKGFIGKITGVVEAGERKWGTAAAVAASVRGGADVVRVHDVGEMGEVVSMADAIWRV